MLRARWKGIAGARKGAVMGLMALATALLMLLVYGITTAGRAPRTDAAVAQDVAPESGGGEWLNQVPDMPKGTTAQTPPDSRPQTPPTPPRKDPPTDQSETPPSAATGAGLKPGVGAGPKPLTPEEQYRLEVERKRREAHLAALVAPPVVGMTASTGSAPPRAATLPEGVSALDPNGLAWVSTSSQATGGGNPGSEDEAQNRQAQKAAFLKAAEARTPGYLDEARTAPLGPYEVKAGSIIPAVLLSGGRVHWRGVI